VFHFINNESPQFNEDNIKNKLKFKA